MKMSEIKRGTEHLKWTDDGFDAQGCCDECLRTRTEGHHPSCDMCPTNAEPTRKLKGVDEHQPDPVQNDLPCIQDLVAADIEARKLVGLQRYGTLLKPHNGRDSLMDAYQEALDLVMYLRQAIFERDTRAY